jgi:hypothetical protein
LAGALMAQVSRSSENKIVEFGHLRLNWMVLKEIFNP